MQLTVTTAVKSLVPTTRHTSIRSIACPSVSSVTCNGYRATSVEDCCHMPLPKIAVPVLPSDFRPISITPVLSRSGAIQDVREFFYPALCQPRPSLDICDQFIFTPSSCTTAAIVAMLHTVRSMLIDNDFLRIFSFDFSKAFNTVWHATLATKLAQLELLDSIYNWTVDFLENHAHCTKYAGEVSAVAVIQARIIQGLAIGTSSSTAADLHPVHDRNRIFKFADDTYLVVPGINRHMPK